MMMVMLFVYLFTANLPDDMLPLGLQIVIISKVLLYSFICKIKTLLLLLPN